MQEEAGSGPVAAEAPQGIAAEIAAFEEADMTADSKSKQEQLLGLLHRVEKGETVEPAVLAMLYNSIGAATFYTQDYAGALDWMAKAAEVLKENGGSVEKIAENLNNRAAILNALGRLGESEALHLESLALRRAEYGERAEPVAESLYNLANTQRSQGRLAEALENIRMAADIQAEVAPENHQRMALRITGLGALLNESGYHDEAIEAARRAEAIAREHLGEDHQLYSVTLNNLSTNLNAAGFYGEALPILREALRTRLRTVGEDHFWTAITLRNLSFNLQNTGQYEEADAVIARAIPIFEKNAARLPTGAMAELLAGRAGIAADRGDWDLYDELMARAIASADAELDDTHITRARTHVFYAASLEQRGRGAEALPIAERWVPVLTAGYRAHHENRLWGEALLARLRQGAGVEAGGAISETLAGLEQALTGLATTDRQLVREAATHRKTAILLFEGAMEAGDHDLAFRALQLANLGDLAVARETAVRDGASGEGEARQLRRTILATARALAELERRKAFALQQQDSDAVGRIEAQIAESQAVLDAGETKLRTRFPDFVTRYRPAPVSLAGMQARLGADEMLLVPIEAETKTWAVRLTREGFEANRLDVRSLRAAVTRLRNALDSGGEAGGTFPLDDAHALFTMLFPNGLDGRAAVRFHGGHSLASLPLGVLTTKPHGGGLAEAPWLARAAQVSVLGNLSLYGSAREEAEGGEELAFVGVGGASLPASQAQGAPAAQLASLFRSGLPSLATIADLPALPNADGELRAIASALPGADVLLVGPKAHEENLKRTDFSGADVVAFATHGLVSGEMRDIWEPALLVGTQEGSGEDGLLGASEIAGLALDADWVILSACNTAAGDTPGTPAYSGLAAAFSEAGARALMLSHWRVRDDVAARLTVETVRGTTRGLSRAEALRQAQLSLMSDAEVRDAAHPAIWAPFIIIED